MAHTLLSRTFWACFLQHAQGDGSTSDDEKELEGLEKSFEAGVKLAKGHRRVCLECFAPEGTPIQVQRCMQAPVWLCCVRKSAPSYLSLFLREYCWWCRCCVAKVKLKDSFFVQILQCAAHLPVRQLKLPYKYVKRYFSLGTGVGSAEFGVSCPDTQVESLSCLAKDVEPLPTNTTLLAADLSTPKTPTPRPTRQAQWF